MEALLTVGIFALIAIMLADIATIYSLKKSQGQWMKQSIDLLKEIQAYHQSVNKLSRDLVEMKAVLKPLIREAKK